MAELLALIAAGLLFALLVRVFVVPVLREDRARRRHAEAAEDQAIEAYFAPLRQDHDDYLTSLSLGFTEDPETFAARIASLDHARYTAAFLSELTAADAAAGHDDRHVPTARKETP